MQRLEFIDDESDRDILRFLLGLAESFLTLPLILVREQHELTAGVCVFFHNVDHIFVTCLAIVAFVWGYYKRTWRGSFFFFYSKRERKQKNSTKTNKKKTEKKADLLKPSHFMRYPV